MTFCELMAQFYCWIMLHFIGCSTVCFYIFVSKDVLFTSSFWIFHMLDQKSKIWRRLFYPCHDRNYHMNLLYHSWGNETCLWLSSTVYCHVTGLQPLFPTFKALWKNFCSLSTTTYRHGACHIVSDFWMF
jgi:hypothetical protein